MTHTMTAGPDYIHGKKANLGFDTGYIHCTILVRNVLYCSVLYIGPLSPVIHRIRVASVIAFSVCSLSVCLFSVTFFLILCLSVLCHIFSNPTAV